jgi:acetyl esterase/lipase
MRLSAFMQRAGAACVLIFLLQAQVTLPIWSEAQQAASQESSIYGAARVDRNVVYGMYSGLALLMDVYHPQKPNGFGAILILGSAWASPLDYGARQLKNSFQELSPFVEPLMKTGYTVFAINHRATPRFHSPAQIEDAHRAVRFVRHFARQYGVDPARIAAVGYSSGAHLASLLGLMDAPGSDSSRDPVEHESGRVQCVVAGGTPADLANVTDSPEALGILTGFLGEQVPANHALNSAVHKRLEEASPIHYVKAGAPPFLLFHGDADELVPYAGAVELQAALAKVHTPVKLITIRGGTHGSVLTLESDEFTGEMTAWLDEYLKQNRRKN